MRLGHLFWIIVTILLIGAMQPVNGVPNYEDDLPTIIKLAEAADTPEKVEFIVNLLNRSSSSIRLSFVRTGLSSTSHNMKLVAVIALSNIDDVTVGAEAFAAISKDSDSRLVRLAWICAKSDFLARDEIDRGWKSEDPIIRSAITLKCIDPERVTQSCLDNSPVVRAFAIRRLAAITPAANKSPDSILPQLTTTLADQSNLVRSNALISARSLRLMPTDIAAGVILDDRPLLLVEDLLGPDKECRQFRAQFNLEEEGYPVAAYLLKLHLSSSISNALPAGYDPLVIPPSDTRIIGSEAANLCANLDPDRYLKVIERIAKSPQKESTLQEHLMKVITSFKHR